MAGRDGTGPMGQGPLTGRGMGICTGARQSRLPFGRGCGMGFGGRGRAGAGFGSRFSGLGFGSTDKEVLSEERELLKQRMEQIDRELED
ncbi:MAG: DUF5320 domain-containing protein [Anaerovoracaceae bacterium]|nr:DUF5320 domain-containing protein [Anaerovoracaceae bacterium]